MASSGNFAIWNRLGKVNPGLSYSGFVLDKGNTRFRGNTGGTSSISSTLSMPSGKWYVEIYAENNPAGGWPALGILKTESISKLQDVSNFQTYSSGQADDRSVVIGTDGDIYKFGSTTNGVAGGVSWSDGDVLQIAVDIDGGKWYFGKNGTYSNSSVPATGANPIDTFTAGTPMVIWVASYNGSSYMYINAGQDSSFSGNISAGTGADDNGFGNFKYSPPSGFLALCSANLPTSSDIDPAETDNDYPQKQFGAEIFTGNGGTQTIQLGDGFQPDFVWLKNIGTANSWVMLDSTRGYNKTLNSNNANAEGTNSYVGYGIESNFFGSTGIVANDGGSPGFNASTNNYIVYGWRANGGTTSTNTSGTITSTVQANTAAGFSIVTYTGDGNDGASIGHGLSSGPNMIFVKNRDNNDSWAVYHSSTGNASHLILDTGTGVTTSSAYWNSFTPSSTVFKVGTDHKLNASTEDYVAYCWHDVEGFQKFGGHVGSGNADGPFIYTGFRPRMIMIKRTDGSHYWYVIDSARQDSTGTFSGVNPITSLLNWDDTIAASTHGFTNKINFVGNGFKVRTTGGSLNGDGGDFISAAWGDVPFKYNNTLP